jgi:hypothetical protein
VPSTARFAWHRDSVSELIGDNLESAIEETLTSYGIGYRKTKRPERIPGFGQAPDFIIPDEFHPQGGPSSAQMYEEDSEVLLGRNHAF